MNKIPQTLYHYTKIETSSCNILESIVRKDCIDFRATYFKRFSIDDYLWVKNYAKPIIEQICIDKGWEYDSEELCVKPYIISFCKNPDSEYMWREYGDNNKGMKLIIDGDLLPKVRHHKTNDDSFYDLECTLPCIYIDSKDEVRKQILEMSQSKLLDDWEYNDRLNLAVVALKQRSPFYKEEEIRYIHLYSKLSSSHYNDSNFYFDEDPEPSADEYHVDLTFPKELLLGIEVGNEVSREQLSYVRQHLIDCEYDPRKVHVTQAR